MDQRVGDLVVVEAAEPMRHPHIPPQCHSDEQLLRMWLHGKADHTVRAYAADAGTFLAFVGREVRMVTLDDVQRFDARNSNRAPVTRARKLGSVKSLLSFAHRIGYTRFNVGAPVQLPKVKETLAERIVEEGAVHRLLALEANPRNHALLRLLYIAGLRISEVCNLRWRDAKPREADAGQITVQGKGDVTGVILLPASMWAELIQLQGEAGPDDPVFLSAKGGHLDPVQVHRIVKAAAARAKLENAKAFSAHWLRHAHASHALDRGAPISLVQQTLRHSNVATTSRYLHAKPNDSSAQYLGT